MKIKNIFFPSVLDACVKEAAIVTAVDKHGIYQPGKVGEFLE